MRNQNLSLNRPFIAFDLTARAETHWNGCLVRPTGGAIKLGNVGERGAPGPAVDLPVSLQDRGYLVSDNLIYDLPREYSSANPIFAGYVADTSLVHNTIRN